MHNLFEEAKSLFSYTQNLRREFHRFPELGFKEFRTSSVVARELRAINLEVNSGIAETGVVAIIDGERPGPVVLARFDMDALPIQEETGAEYASQNAGVMHACGHDGHMAIGLTVARLLHARQKEISGTVKLVFQPAEEGGGGAERMVAEGVLQNPRPEVTFGLHLWNVQKVGWIGISNGPTMAAADRFDLKVIGKGGHGAIPHLAIDPILAASTIVAGVQSIVSRNVSPLKSAVMSFGSIHGGDAFNVIPSVVEMSGTIRTFEPEVRNMVLERMERFFRSTADAMGCSVELSVKSETPPLINDPRVSGHVQKVAGAIFPDYEITDEMITMGSEDMAYLMKEVPGCYFFVGSANPEMNLNWPHHHPRFDIDENSLPIAAALMTGAILEYSHR